jgi:hypothetical protein
MVQRGADSSSDELESHQNHQREIDDGNEEHHPPDASQVRIVHLNPPSPLLASIERKWTGFLSPGHKPPKSRLSQWTALTSPWRQAAWPSFAELSSFWRRSVRLGVVLNPSPLDLPHPENCALTNAVAYSQMGSKKLQREDHTRDLAFSRYSFESDVKGGYKKKNRQ